MHRHVRIAHRAPPQIAQKQGRHREVSQKHKNSTESAPRQRQGTPTRASGAAHGTQEEASRAQKTPRKQYSGALAVPKCSKTHTLATSQRKDKTHPKPLRESQRAPNEDQQGPKRAPRGAPKDAKGTPETSGAQDPKNDTKREVQRGAQNSEKAIPKENTRI